MSSFHELFLLFECKKITFLNFPLLWNIPVFEAAILVYKQKVRSYEMSLRKLLIYMIKVSFVPNSKALSHLVLFLHVSATLLKIIHYR